MKNKKVMIIGVTAAIVLLIGFFVIRPVASSMWNSWKAMSQAKIDLDNSAQKKQAIDELKKNNNLNKISEIAGQYIPEEANAGQLVIEITAMATANNLKVEKTTMEKSTEPAKATTDETDATKKTPTPAASASSETSKTGDAKTVGFSMTVSGSFSDVMNYLKAIEISSRLISISTLTIRAEKQATLDPAAKVTAGIGVDLKGSAYYKSQVTLNDTLDNIKISQETMDKFLNLKTYGQPIDLPTESGFGRENPFEGY